MQGYKGGGNSPPERLKAFILRFFLFDLLDSWFNRIKDVHGLLSCIFIQFFSLFVFSLQSKLFETCLSAFYTCNCLFYLTSNSHRNRPPLISSLLIILHFGAIYTFYFFPGFYKYLCFFIIST